MSPLHFYLCDNAICMPIIVSECFPNKSSILSVIICKPQFFYIYFRLKSSVLSENISTSIFNHILIIFVCLSLYLSFFKKSSILLVMLCNPQIYYTYFRGKSSDLYKNYSSSFFNNTLLVLVCLSLYLSFSLPKYLQFYKLFYVILHFNIHMLDVWRALFGCHAAWQELDIDQGHGLKGESDIEA